MDFQRIKDFFSNDLFAAFSREESIVFLVFTLAAFLLGFIISAIAGGRKRRKLRKELEDLRHELNNTKAELAALQEQQELKTAALQKAELTADDLQNRIDILESEKRQLHTDLYNANEEIEKLNASAQAYAGTIDDLNNQIIGLKTKANEYVGEGGTYSTAPVDSETLNQIQSTYNATLNRLVALEEKLNQLDVENEMLKSELDKMKSGTKPVLAERTPDISTTQAEEESTEAVVEVSTEVLTAEQQKALDLVGGSIPAASADEKDDLTLLNGVGPFLEKKLNSIGIYTYAQIAALDSETIPVVTEAIEFFPGRIEKDNWTGQAKRLMGEEEAPASHHHHHVSEEETIDIPSTEKTVEVVGDVEELELAASDAEEVVEEEVPFENPFSKIKENDLKIIEGIGPKISALLVEAGVDTWQKLSETPVEKLREILENGGKRFKIHDPSTWPQQAEFAANANWQKLKAYQDYLVGGRDVAEG